MRVFDFSTASKGLCSFMIFSVFSLIVSGLVTLLLPFHWIVEGHERGPKDPRREVHLEVWAAGRYFITNYRKNPFSLIRPNLVEEIDQELLGRQI